MESHSPLRLGRGVGQEVVKGVCPASLMDRKMDLLVTMLPPSSQEERSKSHCLLVG